MMRWLRRQWLKWQYAAWEWHREELEGLGRKATDPFRVAECLRNVRVAKAQMARIFRELEAP